MSWPAGRAGSIPALGTLNVFLFYIVMRFILVLFVLGLFAIPVLLAIRNFARYLRVKRAARFVHSVLMDTCNKLMDSSPYEFEDTEGQEIARSICERLQDIDLILESKRNFSIGSFLSAKQIKFLKG